MTDKSLAARNETRRVRRARVFGPEAVCVLCRYANPAALVMMEKTLLEEHHVYGAAFDDATRIPVCRNCHAELTEQVRATGATMRSKRTLFENLIEMSSIEGIYHRAAAIACDRMASELRRRVVALDERAPGWRSIDKET
jgi:hypothetical protein